LRNREIGAEEQNIVKKDKRESEGESFAKAEARFISPNKKGSVLNFKRKRMVPKGVFLFSPTGDWGFYLREEVCAQYVGEFKRVWFQKETPGRTERCAI